MSENKSYKYRVKVGNTYENWSGKFKTKKEALAWYEKYGKSHEARGHKLKLFHNNCNC